MDCALALVGEDFVMLATDMSEQRSIVAYKHDEDKIFALDATKALATGGPHASRTAFSEYIAANVALARLQTDLDMSTEACAHFVRRELARALRSRKGAYECQSLLGGVDKDGTPSLYYLDYLGSMQKINFGAHGYCSNFTLSIFDQKYRKNLSREEARAIVMACIDEVQKRFIIHKPKFIIKIVSRDGISQEVITV